MPAADAGLGGGGAQGGGAARAPDARRDEPDAVGDGVAGADGGGARGHAVGGADGGGAEDAAVVQVREPAARRGVQGEGRVPRGGEAGAGGGALALAARENGIAAHIVMPTISVPQKIAATKGYGANVVFSGSTSVEREEAAARVIAETGARLVPPYDHPDIMLGQGTVGLELQDQVAEMMAAAASKSGMGGAAKGLDAIMTPCGGGGMLSGVALSCEGTGIRVFGAEPSYQGADDGKRGYYAGARVPSVSTLTVADGLRTPVGAHPWAVIYERRLVAGMYSVTEEEIVAAMRLVLERCKMVVEPSACVPLAVALFDEEFRGMVEREAGEGGWDLGLVFSGGNVGVDAIGSMFGGTKEA
ncbi:Putative serine racemase [Tolypocladium paradoxum]|uniref:Serine racemase n=1 Tax=Tolypocladium paradoxum TaxID=94208 RepID=A0A2S4KWA9_9HYPO|nr:Putative serine racemase [Tolypocladium paradoxum]